VSVGELRDGWCGGWQPALFHVATSDDCCFANIYKNFVVLPRPIVFFGWCEQKHASDTGLVYFLPDTPISLSTLCLALRACCNKSLNCARVHVNSTSLSVPSSVVKHTHTSQVSANKQHHHHHHHHQRRGESYCTNKAGR